MTDINPNITDSPGFLDPETLSMLNPEFLEEFLGDLAPTKGPGKLKFENKDSLLRVFGTTQYFENLGNDGNLDFPPNTPILPPPDDEGNPPPAQGKGNVWLDNPNMGAAVTFFFMATMMMLKYSRVIELKFKLAAMEWIGLLAKESSEAVLRSAELEAKRLEVQAMSALIQGAVSLTMAGAVGSKIGLSGGNLSKTMQAHIHAGVFNMGSQGVNHFVEGATKFIEASIVLDKGMVDAWKEVLNGLQRIAEQNMQSSFQSDQELEELLKKMLDGLRTIFEQLLQTNGRIFTS